jgi:hypothetical protein
MKKLQKKVKVKSTKNLIKQAIELNDKMSGCYFWSPPSCANSRRSYEDYNSLEFNFKFNGKKYEIKLNTECSCKNIYFSRNIFVDGIKKNIKALKTII